MTSAVELSDLARAGLDWLVSSARRTTDGLAWSGMPDDDLVDPTLYGGGAGIVVALLEGQAHFGEDIYAETARSGARSIARAAERWDDSSLYGGLTGMAFALRAVGDHTDDAVCRRGADRALAQVRSRFDGERWSEMFELFAGNAGIALGALAAGDRNLARLAVTPYVRAADKTPGGVNWAVRPSPARSHHLAHGTLGIVLALAEVGAATDRVDLVDLALAGAADVVSRNEADAIGFLVPHSDPPHRPELIERWSYGWCNGPAGDAQVFRALGRATGGACWGALAERCWHTVTHSGLPQRTRPGFWDNNGRCCGTAGVLALADDRIVEHGDDRAFAEVLVDDLVARATVDGEGARWSNHESRATPPELAPRRGWAMGNAGIVRELLRHCRVLEGRDPAYAVAWPDHPPARPVTR